MYRLFNKKNFQHDIHTIKYLNSNRISIDIVCQPDPYNSGRVFLYSTTLDSLTDHFIPLSIYNPIIKTYRGKEGYELNSFPIKSDNPWLHNKFAYKGFILTRDYNAVSNRGYIYTTRGRPLIEKGEFYYFDSPLRADCVIH